MVRCSPTLVYSVRSKLKTRAARLRRALSLTCFLSEGPVKSWLTEDSATWIARCGLLRTADAVDPAGVGQSQGEVAFLSAKTHWEMPAGVEMGGVRQGVEAALDLARRAPRAAASRRVVSALCGMGEGRNNDLVQGAVEVSAAAAIQAVLAICPEHAVIGATPFSGRTRPPSARGPGSDQAMRSSAAVIGRRPAPAGAAARAARRGARCRTRGRPFRLKG